MLNPREFVSRIAGPLIPVLAAFDDEERLDIDATCRWIDWLISKGIRLFWTTHGTTGFACLTDGEIRDLTRALAETIRGRGTFIASSAFRWSTNETIAFTHYAAECGADAVKLQIDWAWNPRDDEIIKHYSAIAAESPLPLFAYSLAVPGASAGVSPDLLRRILEIPQFVGLKNDRDDFYGQADYLRTVRENADLSRFMPVTGGSMSSFLFGHELGATAFGTIVGWFAPDAVLEFYRKMLAGERGAAVKMIGEWQDETWAHHRQYGALMHWAWGHAVLMHLRFFRSARMRFPFRTLPDTAMAEVDDFLRRKGIL